MSKNLSAKYYQENKRLQKNPKKTKNKNLMKDNKTKSFYRRTQKMQQYGHECYKNLPEMKKVWKKLLQNEKKCLVIIIRNYYFKK